MRSWPRRVSSQVWMIWTSTANSPSMSPINRRSMPLHVPAGPIDVLINEPRGSASGARSKRCRCPWWRVFSTLTSSAWSGRSKPLCRADPVADSGAVVNISSAAGRTSGSPLGWYGTTKHTLETMSEALRVEVGHLGIRVILLEPGAIDTNFPANRVTAGVDAAPYDTLYGRFTQGISEMRSTVYPPSVVAEVIAEALAEDRPKLRWYGSPDAEAIITSRLGVSDDVLEAAMRQRLGIGPL